MSVMGFYDWPEDDRKDRGGYSSPRSLRMQDQHREKMFKREMLGEPYPRPAPSLEDIEMVVRRVVREELELHNRFKPFVGELDMLVERLNKEKWERAINEAAELHASLM